LKFAFRQDRSYWCLDDISVKINQSHECIVDGGFESGTLSAYPSNLTSSGVVNTACPHTGTYGYYDGNHQQLDYLSQTFSTVSKNVYEISFWLSNLGSSPNSINVTIY
jgi:hypothetical protein